MCALLIEKKRRRRRKEGELDVFACEKNIQSFMEKKEKEDDDDYPEKVMIMPSHPQNDTCPNYELANNYLPMRPDVEQQHCKVRSTITRMLSQVVCQRKLATSAIYRGQSLSLLLLLSVAFTLLLSTTNSNIICLAQSTTGIGSNGNNLVVSNQRQSQHQIMASFASNPTMANNGGNTVITAPTSGKARYRTIYACEDRQLSIDCESGYKINMIRANFGRFSIAQCNDLGQLDMSIDCMSPITLRIMSDRCQDKQKCSVNATSSIFGDKCPKTRKYLEVHFQCQQIQRNTDSIETVNVTNIKELSYSNPAPIMNPFFTHSGSTQILPPNNPTIQPVGPAVVQRPPVTTHQAAGDEQLLRQPNQQSQPQQPTTVSVMNSDIVSYNPDNPKQTAYNQNISDPRFTGNGVEPYIVSLRHTHTDNVSNPRCVLWDKIMNSWTGTGAQIIETNSTHTICAFDQASSYMLVMDYSPYPYQSISPINPPPIQLQPTFQLSPPIEADDSGFLDKKPTEFGKSQANNQQQNPLPSSTVVRFFSLFGYLLVLAFIVVAFMTIAFIASTMRSSASAALKGLGNFNAFSGPKYKSRRSDGGPHNKDLLVINNQNGHQFLYAPASTTKINSSTSTHILSGIAGQHQGTLHQLQQQNQQMYSANGTLSNLSGTGAQSNNYYYGLMGITFQQQQLQSQMQQHLSQHHLNQLQQPVGSYHNQGNKSTISTESANSSPSSSGVESGSASMHQQQQKQQASCLMMNNDYNLMNPLTNYGQHPQNALNGSQHQPTLTLNAHYSSSIPMSVAPGQQQTRMNLHPVNSTNQAREHIYECVDEDKPYSARLLLPTNMAEQFNSNTLNSNTLLGQQQQMNASRAMTLSSRLLQNAIQQQQQQQNNQQNKRLFSHPAIVRDNQAKTNIVCSKMAQVTPQRATEINKFQHDVMAIYNGTETTTTSANSSSSGNSANFYGRLNEATGLGANVNNNSNKLSTDC